MSLKFALMRSPYSLRRICLRSMATTASVADDDASRWIKSYHLAGQGVKNKCISQTEDGHEIRSDVPKAMGGSDTAPQPVYLLLSAMVGCETSTAHFVARKMGLKIDSLSFDLHAWRDQRGVLSNVPSSAEVSASDITDQDKFPSMLQEIKGEVVVKSATATQAQVDALAREVKKRCPVASMISHSGCRLSIKWKLADQPL